MAVWPYGSTGHLARATRFRTIDKPLQGRRLDMPPANITPAQAERMNGPEVHKRLNAWGKGSKWCYLG